MFSFLANRFCSLQKIAGPQVPRPSWKIPTTSWTCWPSLPWASGSPMASPPPRWRRTSRCTPCSVALCRWSDSCDWSESFRSYNCYCHLEPAIDWWQLIFLNAYSVLYHCCIISIWWYQRMVRNAVEVYGPWSYGFQQKVPYLYLPHVASKRSSHRQKLQACTVDHLRCSEALAVLSLLNCGLATTFLGQNCVSRLGFWFWWPVETTFRRSKR